MSQMGFLCPRRALLSRCCLNYLSRLHSLLTLANANVCWEHLQVNSPRTFCLTAEPITDRLAGTFKFWMQYSHVLTLMCGRWSICFYLSHVFLPKQSLFSKIRGLHTGGGDGTPEMTFYLFFFRLKINGANLITSNNGTDNFDCACFFFFYVT